MIVCSSEPRLGMVMATVASVYVSASARRTSAATVGLRKDAAGVEGSVINCRECSFRPANVRSKARTYTHKSNLPDVRQRWTR
jgi:hypothetical protein